jgi:hypothetical protein
MYIQNEIVFESVFDVGFEVYKAVIIWIVVCWDMTRVVWRVVISISEEYLT